MKAQKIKGLLFYLAFLVIFLPLLVDKLHFIETSALKGSYKLADDTTFSLQGWLSGAYQRKKEQYLNDNTSFRPDLIRLINQIDYSMFDKCHAGWDVKGKDRCLFQFPYIDAYYGKDYAGYNQIYSRSTKLKAIQDTLGKLGKHLIVAFLPCKASFYPEYFPNDRVEKTRGMTNFQAYRQLCDSLGIHVVDMDTWFRSMKYTSREPLFSRQGTHWTVYGAILGGDSLIRYMEHLTGIAVEHPNWAETEHSKVPRMGDDDVASEMNLIFPVAEETLAYPKVKEIHDTGRRKINAIYIGDSYMTKMVLNGVIQKMNKQCEYWSYFEEAHNMHENRYATIAEYDWKGAMKTADCIVIAYTLFNLRDFGSGFTESAFNYYYPQGTQQPVN